MHKRLWNLCASDEDKTIQIAELLEKDPYIDINWRHPNHDGRALLHMLVINRHTSTLKRILSHPHVDVNSGDDRGNTPFIWACSSHTRIEAVKILLGDSRTRINVGNLSGPTALSNALRCDNIDAIELMIASGRKIDCDEGDPRYSSAAWASSSHTLSYRLLQRFQRNPETTRRDIQKDLESGTQLIARIYALIVLIGDGYFTIRQNHRASVTARFFRMTSRLPIELQMVMCHRLFNSARCVVLSSNFKRALKNFIMD
jgi:hypothetical protein